MTKGFHGVLFRASATKTQFITLTGSVILRILFEEYSLPVGCVKGLKFMITKNLASINQMTIKDREIQKVPRRGLDT